MSDTEVQVAEPVETPETEAFDDAAALAELEAGEVGLLDAQEETAEPEQPTEPEQPAVVDEKYENLKKALNESRYETRQFKRELSEIKDLLRQPQSDQPSELDDLFAMEFPDPDADPLGAVRALTQFASRYRQQQQQEYQAQQQEAQYTAQKAALTNIMREAETGFREQTPDYDDAVKHLLLSRATELESFGWEKEQIRQQVEKETLDLVWYAQQQGQNPAAIAYAQAQARGYAFKAPGPEGQAISPPAPKAQAQLEAMKRGAEVPQAPKGGGGGAKAGQVTDDMLMNAKGSEFEKLWARFEAQQAQG